MNIDDQSETGERLFVHIDSTVSFTLKLSLNVFKSIYTNIFIIYDIELEI